MALTAEQLKAIMPNITQRRVNLYLEPLNAAMVEFQITNDLRQAAFLAQLAHESGELRYMEEIASGAAYEGRKDLGNTQKGDGKRFKGRGPIQLTGRANYAKYGGLLGVDLVNSPGLAATPEVGFRVAGLYWKLKGLNELADQQKFKEITKRINGGYNGLADREQFYARAKKALADKPKAVSLAAPQGDEVKATATVTVVAEQAKPTNPKEQGVVAGIKTHVASAIGFLTTAGAGLISWVQGASTPLILGFFGAAALIGMTYIISRNWIRNKENQRLAEVQLEREKMAHEITLLKMKSAMDSKGLTVEVEHVEDMAPREEPKE